MFAEEIRRQAEAAPRAALPAVTVALWRAFREGKVSEAEAETLSALIEARTLVVARRGAGPAPQGESTSGGETTAALDAPGDRQDRARRPGVGSRPRSPASLERRRRWAASGRLPPGLAARFTPGEIAVLSLVAAETARRGDCRLTVGHIAAVAGVGETTVRNAIRAARQHELVSVEERPVTGFRNLSNIVRIVSREWEAWLRLARRWDVTRPPEPRTGTRETASAKGGGCKSPKRTPTKVLTLCESRPAEPSQGCREAAVDPGQSAPSRIRTHGGTGRAMR